MKSKFIIRFLLVSGILIILMAGFIKPVDRTHFLDTSYYHKALKKLDSLRNHSSASQPSQLEAGWAKTNITPDHATPLSGYGSRKGALSTGVHDSLWARGFIFKNHDEKIAFVTLDALLIPPTVTYQLMKRLPSIGYDIHHVYLTATHTHCSVGAWGTSWIGEKFAGDFDQKIVNQLASSILDVIMQAEKNLEPAIIGYAEYDAPELVTNRLVGKDGIIDPWFRVVKIQKKSGSSALLTTFAAHATCLSEVEYRFSRDYPGALVDSLEALENIEFAAFAAGGVGSHRPESGGYGQFDRINWLASSLTKKVHHESINLKEKSRMKMVLMAIPLREAHWRFSENWRFRPWVFKWFIEDSPQYITAFRIGNIVFSGTPCDFSGELIPEIKNGIPANDIHLIVTSFNGGYIGYITKDCWYDMKEYETFIMNWFGPYNGQYFVNMIRKIVNIIIA